MIRIVDVALLYRTKAFNKTFYERQIGRHYNYRIAAIWDYVFHRSNTDIDCSPIFSPLWLRSQGVAVRNLADYLRNWKSFEDKTPHPLFDPRVQLDRTQGKQSKYGPLESFSASATLSSVLPYRPQNAEGMSITVGALCAQRLAFDQPTESPEGKKSVSVSVIVDDVGSVRRAKEVIRTLDKAGPETDFEIILIPSDGRRELYGLLIHLELIHERVRIRFRPMNVTRAYALNHAVAESLGRNILFMHVGHRFAQGSLARMAQFLESSSCSIVQPLVLDTNGLIWSAGIAFPFSKPTPIPWLRGISPLTAELPESFSVEGAQFPFMIRRREDDADLYFCDGLGDIWMDLNVSLGVAGGAKNGIEVLAKVEAFRVMKSPYEPTDTESYLSNDLCRYWAQLGLRPGIPSLSTTLESDWPDHLRLTSGVPDFRMHKPIAKPRTAGGRRRLRWSIKTAAPSTFVTEDEYRWGDTYFAASLQAALVRLGQIVTVDSVENREKSTGYLDDVVLNLRGYEPIVPVKGAINITWVISHPELVTPIELQNSQIVYAASHRWSEFKSREWSINIRTLLQCTDSHIFYPLDVIGSKGDNIVFVGNTRGRERTLVSRAIAAGRTVEVYGRGWEGGGSDIQVIADHIENAALRNLYGSSGLILSDHWPSMREWGFMSNRAFDIVASGGRVLSDSIQGFPAELSRQMALSYDSDFLSGNDPIQKLISSQDVLLRQDAAEYVLEHHTFDTRATQILNDVMALLDNQLKNIH